MAGLDENTPIPTQIVLHQQSKKLEITFDNGAHFILPAELMRVYSPSAEVKGHGPGQEVLQVGKRNVGVSTLEGVGLYAIRPTFDDGHDTGIFAWDYLYWLGENQEALWNDYFARLEQAGASREPEATENAAFTEHKPGGCGHHH